ncbi:MAG: Gfo/Idh/MocA family oxidoreductase, partial [Acetomicrobium sp.]|jgi:predicted dehydrogenase|uniref:Oxidoreductase, NAD-binding domain protein n=2 Tax=Acetomicrobium TaxID=49894 RepID=A0A0T5XCM1_9BACT|nr:MULTISPECIES: Gfo/Idh/MocA family oxidoreductase [Acetomicrobium]KRT36107.1 oxidoreductase, NAD-binding domain protein [Acetomicrobium hydrogeniformans ATCC BAA-1850]MBC7323652.1 Gfo/Idh/MocA family oxidoreductase [Acetomicrobium sp.]SDY04845.1 Predicted dehydrogenase [Acetomicrobium thermoterrenum DSM 13490]
MNALRVGVIGVGHLGYHHARIYSELLETRLAGVMDIDDQRAVSVGEMLQVPYFSDLDEFLEKARPDALSIVVPTVAHYEVAKKVMERGIHVLIEKPVTKTVDEAEELLKLAAQKNLVLQVGHIERFNSAVQYVRGICKPPLYIQTRRLGPFSSRVADVGVVLDLMIHDIDIILSLVGSEISEISAYGRSVFTEHEDIASAHLTFKNGAISHILVSRASEKRLRTLEIMERERYITLNYETQDVSIHRCIRNNGMGLMEVIEHPVFPKHEPLKMELQHFISCVKEGRQPMVGIADGKRALEIAVEVLRQINKNKSADSDENLEGLLN